MTINITLYGTNIYMYIYVCIYIRHLQIHIEREPYIARMYTLRAPAGVFLARYASDWRIVYLKVLCSY